MNKYILGIDTSAYTTSMAVVNEKKELLIDERIALEVKKGRRGLRQSEAIFQHMKNIPLIYGKISKKINLKKIDKVCCSTKPRNLENSYMPVFLSGLSFGKVVSATLNIPFEEYSHQEGHIEAAKWSSNALINDEFIALHISGGTMEMLKVVKEKNKYECEIIGGTMDISAGQLIDRIGVMMGLAFPAGKELDEISKNGVYGKIKLPLSTKGTYINFSGAETYTKKIISEGNENIGDIAISLFDIIYKSLYKIICSAVSLYGINEILVAGGVASNRFLRDNLYRELNKKGINIHFCEMEFCTDNGVGIALLGTYDL